MKPKTIDEVKPIAPGLEDESPRIHGATYAELDDANAKLCSENAKLAGDNRRLKTALVATLDIIGIYSSKASGVPFDDATWAELNRLMDIAIACRRECEGGEK